MTSLRQALICSALVCLCALLVALTACAVVVSEVVIRLPQELNAAVLETRSQLLGEVATTRAELLKHLAALEARADSRLASIQADARLELAATRKLVNSQLSATLGRADQALSEVASLHSELRPIIENAGVITAHVGNIALQVDDSAGMFLDCDHNPDCLMNRYVGASKGIERAAQNVGAMSTEVRGALPAALLTWQSIGGNVDQTSANVARITKPRWFDSLIKGLAAGVTVGAVLK